MSQNKDMENYIEAAKSHRRYSYSGQYKEANKEFSKLKKIFTKFEKEELEKDLLIRLLDHQSLEVQSWAAAHLLGLDYKTGQAIKALERLEKGENKKIAFNAKMTLQVWEKQGFLKF